ncbi:MAG: ferrochelatase, partial [Desulfobulbaceae bacterium]|nr:ferrochelatase [Desulfobulbaceae bacterium]HIJ91129.1 ferrochelatase [Deltaproteobacteria bacterium]
MSEPVGVILLNLGGPETLADVEPFLVNLFSDRTIIRLSPFPFLQKFIARRIAAKRAPKSREAYRLIGGGSPLARITGEQGRALQEALSVDGRFLVGMAMRYWPPYAAEALQLFARAGIDKVVALTLYPHYSRATTGSSLDALGEAVRASGGGFQVAEVRQWPEQSDYIECLARIIREGMLDFGAESVQLVYSAHSLPVKFIAEGDPYLDQIKQTIAAVEKLTGIPGRLCFQSRSGPVQWLSPSTPEMLKTLAGEGCKNILMVRSASS